MHNYLVYLHVHKYFRIKSCYNSLNIMKPSNKNKFISTYIEDQIF